METVRVGIVGSGFAAELHAQAYRRVYGLQAIISGAASLDTGLAGFAARHNIEKTTDDYRELLRDPDIQVIDIITPPHLHASMIREAMEAGKHVICEKPLTGYFGREDDPEPIGKLVPKEAMYSSVMAEMAELERVVSSSGKEFFYAENFIYAPAVLKCEEMLAARKGKLLFLRGEESHCGSHAEHAAHWKYAGGGSLIRQGCHPLSALLYLKYREAECRGEEVRVTSVSAETGVTAGCLSERERGYIHSRPVDVEDMAVVTMTFSDGTKALVLSGDMVVGGVRNVIELYTDNGVYTCNMAPNNGLTVFHADDRGLEDIYITEKLDTKTGWQQVFLEEEIMRGYAGEIQDFMECVAYGRRPKSGFSLARDTLQVVYAAYQSAQEGKRIDIANQPA